MKIGRSQAGGLNRFFFIATPMQFPSRRHVVLAVKPIQVPPIDLSLGGTDPRIRL